MLSNFITKSLLSKWAKGLLDKLPLDGKKTLLSFVLFVVTSAISIACVASGGAGLCSILSTCQGFLVDTLGVTNMSGDAAAMFIGTFLLGLFHKGLKSLEKKTDSGLPPAKV